MITVLRLAHAGELISAQVFDELFARNLALAVKIRQANLLSWCEMVLGKPLAPFPFSEAARRFSDATVDCHFLCPNREGITLTPLLLALRNHCGARIRLLLIAHSPGAYLLEWVLLRPLLRPGDRVIAPSRSAADLISFLCPELHSFVRVIPHPMHPLPTTSTREAARIVSLGRLVRGKLIHRQIEAMGILRARTGLQLKLEIGGPVGRGTQDDPLPYVRALMAQIRRLRLEDSVELRGEIRGDAAKAHFLSNSRMLLNLSVTVEESFGKSVVEALGLGVPVVATNWDGLPETVGMAGRLLSVTDTGLGMDVASEQIADTIERLMTSPPEPETCRAQAAQFAPAKVSRRYAQVLEEAVESIANQPRRDEPTGVHEPAAPSHGLLAYTAPLAQFSWAEIFGFHVEDCARLRGEFAGVPRSDVSHGDRIRNLLLSGTRAAVERFLAGLQCGDLAVPIGRDCRTPSGTAEWWDRLAEAAVLRATPRSRLVCLLELSSAGNTEQLCNGVQALAEEGLSSWGLDYLRAEAERQRGNFVAAFNLCVDVDDSRLWGELAAYRLRQLARVARDWGRPGIALPWLRDRLTRFPDSPDSGAVWLDRCLNAHLMGREFAAEARESYACASSLLGPSPILYSIGASLAS